MTKACVVLVSLGLAFALAGCRGLSGGVETRGNAHLLEQENVQDLALRRAADLVDSGDGRRAFKILVDRFKSEPQAAYRDVSLWLAANALVEDGQRIRAFYYLDQLMDEHSDSSLYYAAARKQYEIADSYLRNRSDRMLFFPVRQHEAALEMLFRVQQRLPGSPLAELALKRSADFYFANGDYDFAEDAYGVFIDRFPRSQAIPTVRLKQAYSNLLQYQGPRYDPTPLLDAATQLRQFRVEYPELARDMAVDERIDWVDEQLAEKLVLESSFFARTGEPAASRRLLAEVIERYPETPQAERARRRLGTTTAAEPGASGEVQP